MNVVVHLFHSEAALASQQGVRRVYYSGVAMACNNYHLYEKVVRDSIDHFDNISNHTEAQSDIPRRNRRNTRHMTARNSDNHHCTDCPYSPPALS